jgi:hypothetical protein
VKLSKRAREHEINGIARQPVTGDRITGHALVFEDFETHPNDAREDNVCRGSISGGESQKPWQSLVRKFEDDKDDKPDAKNA